MGTFYYLYNCSRDLQLFPNKKFNAMMPLLVDLTLISEKQADGRPLASGGGLIGTLV